VKESLLAQCFVLYQTVTCVEPHAPSLVHLKAEATAAAKAVKASREPPKPPAKPLFTGQLPDTLLALRNEPRTLNLLRKLRLLAQQLGESAAGLPENSKPPERGLDLPGTSGWESEEAAAEEAERAADARDDPLVFDPMRLPSFPITI